jgi:hypothetical protein
MVAAVVVVVVVETGRRAGADDDYFKILADEGFGYSCGLGGDVSCDLRKGIRLLRAGNGVGHTDICLELEYTIRENSVEGERLTEIPQPQLIHLK